MNRIKEIFAEALDREGADLTAYLDQACADDPELRVKVEGLLAAAGQTDAFRETTGSNLSERPGTVIGRYKLLEQIGEGGFGVVFMADQEAPIRRRVALKIIKLGMDTKQVIARFEAERQALAMMDHPNIAKVLDAGATETGRPYFVMELVRGAPITEYCDLNNLTMAQRLELFIPICNAIQHAHQKGIIHRDIKPTNVLVTLHDGVPVPKVIDFGIAKATDQRLTDKTLFTAFQQFMGTPAYMSPEQAEMSGLDIDTRSDIYSLGVLLYELITGKTPFDSKELLAAGVDAMRQTIRNKEPVNPSMCLRTMLEAERSVTAALRKSDPIRLVHLLSGDLDWIVMKAIEKDRTRRYETASALAADVRHHLNDETVTARPPSRLYRFRKVVRRNKPAVAGAVLLATVLVLGIVVSSWQAVRATRARDEAIRQQQVAAAEREFLANMLSKADPNQMLGENVTVLQAIQAAANQLDGGALSKQPMVESSIRSTIGETLRSLDRDADAEPNFRKALEIDTAHLSAGDPQIARDMFNLAVAIEHQDRFGESEELLRKALALQRSASPVNNTDIANTMEYLGYVLDFEGRDPEAEPLERDALAILRESLPPDDPAMLGPTHLLVQVCAQRNDFAEAELIGRQALSISRKAYPPGHPQIAECLYSLSMALNYEGKYPEAEHLARECVEIRRKTMRPGHYRVLLAMEILQESLVSEGRLVEAEQVAREAYDLGRASKSVRMNQWTEGLADVLENEGKYSEEESLCRGALAIGGAPDPNDFVPCCLAAALAGQGKYAEAERILRAQTAIVGASGSGSSAPTLRWYLDSLIWVLARQGKYADAVPFSREALATSIKMGGLNDSHTQNEAKRLYRLLQEANLSKDAAAVQEQFHLPETTTQISTTQSATTSP